MQRGSAGNWQRVRLIHSNLRAEARELPEELIERHRSWTAHSSQLSLEWVVQTAAALFPYAQLNPLLFSGRVLIRLPVAAKMALQIAGKTGGSVGSPKPVGA